MIAFIVTDALEVAEIAADGKRIVARFNLSIEGACYLTGCALLHRREKGWTIWGPSKSVKFTSRLRRQIKCDVLRQLGREIPPKMERAAKRGDASRPFQSDIV